LWYNTKHGKRLNRYEKPIVTTAPRVINSICPPLLRIWHCLLLGLLLVSGCASGGTATSLPGKAGISSVADLLTGTPVRGSVTVVGYLFVRPASVVLLDGLSFSATPPPQPLASDPSQQIWIGPSLDASVAAELEQRGAVQYGIVQAQGQVRGPGSFGPEGRYPYQFMPDSLKILSPETVTIGELLARTAAHEQQFVRVEGELLTSEDTALLVSRIGAGGVPASNSRQLKLPVPLRAPALLDHLAQVADTPIYFGPVQIDGIWRGDILQPLGVTVGEIS
jgi:hypothetical protein